MFKVPEIEDAKIIGSATVVTTVAVTIFDKKLVCKIAQINNIQRSKYGEKFASIPIIKIQSRLGQSIDTKSHKISVPKKIPTTAISFEFQSPRVGKNLKLITISTLSAISTYLLILFLVLFNIMEKV